MPYPFMSANFLSPAIVLIHSHKDLKHRRTLSFVRGLTVRLEAPEPGHNERIPLPVQIRIQERFKEWYISYGYNHMHTIQAVYDWRESERSPGKWDLLVLFFFPKKK